MKLPTKDNPSIKWVKRAKAWCKTYFELNERTNTYVQKQEWSDVKPSVSRTEVKNG